MNTSKPEQDATTAPAIPEGEQGKTAKELQQEEPPPGLDQQPPTDPAGSPHLA